MSDEIKLLLGVLLWMAVGGVVGFGAGHGDQDTIWTSSCERSCLPYAINHPVTTATHVCTCMRPEVP